MEWFYIIAGWIFLNVIVKLFVNSFERIFKERIDESVKKAPSVMRNFFIEIIRIIFIALCLPYFIVKLIPLSISNRFIEEIRNTTDIMLSKRGFRNLFPFFVLLLVHPSALFSLKRQDELWKLWIHNQTKNIRNRNKRRLTSGSS
jgi:hypothetical protein